jgi:hypothetical protein
MMPEFPVHTRNPNEKILNYDGHVEKLIASCTCGWVLVKEVYRQSDSRRQTENFLTAAWADHLKHAYDRAKQQIREGSDE